MPLERVRDSSDELAARLYETSRRAQIHCSKSSARTQGASTKASPGSCTTTLRPVTWGEATRDMSPAKRIVPSAGRGWLSHRRSAVQHQAMTGDPPSTSGLTRLMTESSRATGVYGANGVKWASGCLGVRGSVRFTAWRGYT